MATNITPIDPEELVGRGVVGLPDSPELDVLDMQNKFDDIALNVIIPHINGMVTEINEAVDGAIEAAHEEMLAEKDRAEDAELALSTAIDDETARAQAAEGDLSDAIGAEKLRAEGVEGQLSDAITAEKNRAEGAEGLLSTAIGNEKTRAEGVEGQLSGAITSLTASFNSLGLTVQNGKLCAIYNT